MNIVNDTLQLLGLKVTDMVTGQKGIIVSVCFDLYGCVQAALNPGMDKDGKQQDSMWFDVSRLHVISNTPVMPRPEFASADKGPAEKPCARR